MLYDNFVQNKLVLLGDKEQVQQLDEMFESGMDFNLVIPVRGETQDRLIGWGTTQNARDTFFDGTAICFLSSKTAPHQVIHKLSEMFPDVEINHMYADYPYSLSVTGHLVYKGGDIVRQKTPLSFDERLNFACYLWKFNLKQVKESLKLTRE